MSVFLLIAAVVVGTWNGNWFPSGRAEHRAHPDVEAATISAAAKMLANGLRAVDPYGTNDVVLCLNEMRGPKAASNLVAQIGRPGLRIVIISGYRRRDRFDQQPLYYKVFRSERLGIYLILALIILISTLNLVASLSLLIIDKQHDISTMRSMGMTTQSMRRMFFEEGLLISAVGIAVGLLLGFVVCFLQQQFGLIRMGDNFVVSAFPVAMRGIDFLSTFLLVAFLSSIAVFLTTRRAKI